MSQNLYTRGQNTVTVVAVFFITMEGRRIENEGDGQA